MPSLAPRGERLERGAQGKQEGVIGVRWLLWTAALCAVAVGLVGHVPSAMAQYYPDPYAGYGYGAPYGYYGAPYYGYSPYYSYGYYGAPYYGYPGYNAYYPYGYPYPTPYYGGYPYAAYAPYGAPPPLGAIVVPYGTVPPGYAGAGAFQLTATMAGPNVATLSWNPVPGAVSYTIYQGVNGGPLTFVQQTTSTTVTVPVTPPNSYVFQVHALGSSGFEIGVSNLSPPLFAGISAPFAGFGAVSATTSTVSSPTTTTSWIYPTQVTVVVRNAAGQPLPGVPVVMMASRPGDMVTPSSVPTDGNGMAVFTLKGGAPGTATFTPVAGGVPLTPVTITFQ